MWVGSISVDSAPKLTPFAREWSPSDLVYAFPHPVGVPRLAVGVHLHMVEATPYKIQSPQFGLFLLFGFISPYKILYERG